MSVFGKVQERQYELIPTGEYVWTLNEIEYSPEGQYGEALIWKWMLAEVSTPTDYLCKKNGDEHVIYQYTDVDLNIGSKQHAWAQLLYGKTLEKGAAPPDEAELIGRRMIAYLNHHTPKRGKNAGNPREAILDGSAKPFRGVQPNPVVKYDPKPAAPSGYDATLNQVSADATLEDVDRALVVTLLQKRAASLKKLDAEAGRNAQDAIAASDLQAASLVDLQSLSDAIQAQVTAALDD